MERVAVSVHAVDPISRLGMETQLRPRPELRIAEDDTADTGIGLVVVERLDEEGTTLLRKLHRGGTRRLILVPAAIDDVGLSSAVEHGVVALVRRREASAERMAHVIMAVSRGEGALPADLLARLMAQMGRLQRQVLEPRGLNLLGLSTREIDVLRLVADGRDTREIAAELAYSERTVKNILHDVTRRLQLRNRAHAVAYALRNGLI
ncbi:helix-turn-helix transcriptional regulator [Pilimelia anulata]|uniref:Helix-turn-helix transcriptional regulator n=1 Tax=Pilimelia anulata TaxID=53371 RepID=A0A8J3FET8_9ACTN|nr:response regulator transcription factor [Pilimelia anulata]GGK10122.1 helix-turn-helix transcriptional regulator [Pilimelia anulata]